MLFIFLLFFCQFASALVLPTFSVENAKICSGYRFNWAAEIRCLRQTLNSCIQKQKEGVEEKQLEDFKRDERSLGQFSNEFLLEPDHNGLKSLNDQNENEGKSASPPPYNWKSRARPTMRTMTAMMTTTSSNVENKQQCSCDLEQFERNLTKKFEKQLYQVKMGGQYECQQKINEARKIAEEDLLNYQRMTDKDLREIKRKLEWIQAKKIDMNGFQYSYIERYENWYDAESYCIGLGGHLASIHSDEENEIVANLLPESTSAWFSLNDVQKENVFVNPDKTKSNYRNWKTGQPDNRQHNENCVEIEKNGKWSDLLCIVSRPFVCKKKY